MTVVGMWLAIMGYGLAYAGAIKLAGRECGIIDAFRGKCIGIATASTPAPGQTQQSRAAANQQAQASMIGTQPISQSA